MFDDYDEEEEYFLSQNQAFLDRRKKQRHIDFDKDPVDLAVDKILDIVSSNLVGEMVSLNLVLQQSKAISHFNTVSILNNFKTHQDLTSDNHSYQMPSRIFTPFKGKRSIPGSAMGSRETSPGINGSQRRHQTSVKKRLVNTNSRLSQISSNYSVDQEPLESVYQRSSSVTNNQSNLKHSPQNIKRNLIRRIKKPISNKVNYSNLATIANPEKPIYRMFNNTYSQETSSSFQFQTGNQGMKFGNQKLKKYMETTLESSQNNKSSKVQTSLGSKIPFQVDIGKVVAGRVFIQTNGHSPRLNTSSNIEPHLINLSKIQCQQIYSKSKGNYPMVTSSSISKHSSVGFNKRAGTADQATNGRTRFTQNIHMNSKLDEKSLPSID